MRGGLARVPLCRVIELTTRNAEFLAGVRRVMKGEQGGVVVASEDGKSAHTIHQEREAGRALYYEREKWPTSRYSAV